MSVWVVLIMHFILHSGYYLYCTYFIYSSEKLTCLIINMNQSLFHNSPRFYGNVKQRCRLSNKQNQCVGCSTYDCLTNETVSDNFRWKHKIIDYHRERSVKSIYIRCPRPVRKLNVIHKLQ